MIRFAIIVIDDRLPTMGSSDCSGNPLAPSPIGGGGARITSVGGSTVCVMRAGRVCADGAPAALRARYGARDLQAIVLQLTAGEGGG